MEPNRAGRQSVWEGRGRSPFLAAACVALLIGASTPAAAAERLAAAVLTRDLGDPRAPGNLKLAVTLPEEMYQHNLSATARDFSVYVYPQGIPESEGAADAYRAGGVYLWRGGDKLFLDARVVPLQDAEGFAAVKVVYHPLGKIEAEGVAEGLVAYATELVDVVMAVDVSSSMSHTDPRRRRVAAASTFLEMARRGGGIGRIGLVTFNSRANLVTPLLPLGEGETLLDALQRVGADGMTNLDAPLRMGMEELASGEGSRRPVVILLTDGRNEGHRYRDSHLELAEKGIRIFTVGLTERADHKLLKEMADATGGLYFRAPTDDDLPEIYARLAAELGKRRLLRSDLLHDERGRTRAPIDSSVKRLVAIADGGARVGISRPGDRGPHAAPAMSSAHLTNPEPGSWEFAWERAAPDISVLSLFGDTQFFLDVFPPQLRGGRLSLGATLAEGARPLSGARVWAWADSGVIDYSVELFDDGMHGDGEAGDGVYGALVDFHRDDVERFDMTFRSAGADPDRGEFVRQASGLALRSREPSRGGSVGLIGGPDFGVLFPGETGSAPARVDLNAKGPRELDFDLYWHVDGGGWPDMSSRVLVRPGRRAFELEMTVPESAEPGDYLGRFSVSDRDELNAFGDARVRVGDVVFDAPPFVDLGAVPPGTFSASAVRLPYRADKDVAFRFEADGDAGLRIDSETARLSAGSGDALLDAVVTAPMGAPEGEYGGVLRVFAGPGRAEIPLRWRVKAYAVADPGELPPVSGVPSLPDFPDMGEMAALAEPPPPDGSLFPADSPGREPMDSDASRSPWEKAQRAIRSEPAAPAAALSGPGDFDFDTAAEPKRTGEGFWSAWWLYLLALLILILLLLLLAAYILYRLGKSELARLLLVSGLANLLLLAAFLALLGTAETVSPERPPTVTVSLVRDDYQPPVEYYTELERDMLAAPSPPPDSPFAAPTDVPAEAAAGGGAAGQAAADQSWSDSGGLVAERTSETAVAGEVAAPASETRLAMADNPAAEPMESASPKPMTRREWRRERRDDRSDMPASLPALPEADEPPAEAGEKAGEHVEVGETRIDIESDRESDRPVWSDGRRIAQPAAVWEGLLMAEAAGMETVRLDPESRRVDPKGRRRTVRDAPDVLPEPRVEIADPVRDAGDVSPQDARETGEGPPGVEEIRAEPRSMGTRPAGSKPGALAAPGVSALETNIDRQAPRGVSGDDDAAPSLARGGIRTLRGGAGRAGAARPDPAGTLPGGLLNENTGKQGGGDTANGVTGGTGNARGGGNVGERRFDGVAGGGGSDADAGAPSGGGRTDGGGNGLRAIRPGGGGDEFGPSRLAGGGGGGDGERVAFAPGGGGGGSRPGGGIGGSGGDGTGFGDGGGLERGGFGGGGGDGHGPRRGSGRGFGDGEPRGLGGIPGGSGGDGQGVGNGDGSRPGSGRGRGAGDVGEGRFDSLPGAGDGSGLAQRGGAATAGSGRSALDDGGAGPALGATPLASAGESWFVDRRREPRRQLTAASSSLEIDSLLVVVGDFQRLPDPAAENLFAALAKRIGGGMTVEERRLAPDDANLSDTLLAILSPEEARGWSDNDIAGAGAYLAGGGHIWLDASRPGQADDFMRRLARAAGGEYGPLPATHPLAQYDKADAVAIDGKIAAVATAQDWRNAWRYESVEDGPAMRFLIRGLNYFLSGNAESGIVLDPTEPRDGLRVEPHAELMPDSLSSGEAPDGMAWDSFDSASVRAWRMPAWSDPGEVSSISDGRGGRALKLDLAASVKGRVAVYRVLNPNQDFSRTRRMTLDVYHDGDGEAAVSLVFTVPAAGGWADFETPPARLGPGWNRVEFRLDAANFRSLADGGSFSMALPGADRAGRVGFFLYRDGSSAAIAMFRDVRLHEH